MKKILLIFLLLISVKVKAKTFNVYDNVYASNIAKTDSHEKLDTSKPGTYKINIENNEYTYKVKDFDNPILISAITNKTIKKGNTYDFCKNAIFIDNYDRKPECQVEGTYDKNTLGTYNLKYILKDSSNNKTEGKLIINVVNQINSVPSTQNITYDNFDDIKNKYPNNKVGIDVSKWQGKINFKKVSKKADFIFIRMGLNNQEIKFDDYYKRNIKEAKKYKMKVGIYFYSTAETTDEAREEARWILKNLDYELDYPIVFDWENYKDIRKYKLNLYDLNNLYLAFKDELNKAGYGTILYSSKNYLGLVWQNFSSPVWLAHYTENTNYDGSFIMWQKTDQGKIDGIKTTVDIDILYDNSYKGC